MKFSFVTFTKKKLEKQFQLRIVQTYLPLFLLFLESRTLFTEESFVLLDFLLQMIFLNDEVKNA